MSIKYFTHGVDAASMTAQEFLETSVPIAKAAAEEEFGVTFGPPVYSLEGGAHVARMENPDYVDPNADDEDDSAESEDDAAAPAARKKKGK